MGVISSSRNHCWVSSRRPRRPDDGSMGRSCR
jgi:hypothetical protein